MKKSLLFLFLVLCCWGKQTLAQTHIITGKITSAEDGLPLPGVSVKITGATVGAVSDGQGNYSIKANPGQVISYSFIGTVSQQKTVGTTTVINVVLQADSKMLQEVKVTTGF